MWINALIASPWILELTLFALFILAAWYAIRTYVTPALYQLMHQAKDHVQYLLGKKELLGELESRLAEDTIMQDERIASMKQKLHIWQAAQRKSLNALQESIEQTYAALEKKRLLQQQNVYILKITEEALDPAIHMAQQEMATMLSGPKGAKKLNELIESMTQSNAVQSSD